jgi:hypothetical protein
MLFWVERILPLMEAAESLETERDLFVLRRGKKMTSRGLLAGISTILLLALVCGDLAAAELASVNGESVTAEEFLRQFRAVSGAGEALEKTLEGKKDFLERLIAKHLLSQCIHERGWDQDSTYDVFLMDFARGEYLQALYREAIPECATSGFLSPPELMSRAKIYVDSLQKAYNLTVDESAVILMADRSIVRHVDKDDTQSQHEVTWSSLFTDEEKEMVAASFLNGHITIGEVAQAVDEMPLFARPTKGDPDGIAANIKHFGRGRIFEHEFNKLGLENQPYFREKMQNKREEYVLMDLFRALRDTSRVTREEVQEYYETHRDDYVTQTVINLALMSFDSEDVAIQAAQRISEGEDFESVAIDFSVFSGSETGYDTTGFIDKSKMPVMFDAIWEKEIGGTAGPVYETDRWSVGKLLGRQDPRLLSLEEAAPMIEDTLRFLKADGAFAGFIEDLRSKAEINIDYDALAALELP